MQLSRPYHIKVDDKIILLSVDYTRPKSLHYGGLEKLFSFHVALEVISVNITLKGKLTCGL